ncbi:MAG: MarC family protein [Rickettsiales bacterium]|nr:MarC family protein [Rickettsiales bacterium]
MNIELYKTAFLTMFVALDPPGLAPVFITLTAHMGAHERKATAYRGCLIAFSILAGAAICGEPLLRALGIGVPAFRIAGGLLLFWIAAEMVFERREERKTHSAEETIAHDHFHSIAAFPLAIPLMAGPGAITATILQASRAQGSYLDFAVLIAILGVVILSCLAVFLLASRIDKLLGHTGRVVLSRLLGVLLAAMAVQIVGDGIVNFR